MSKKISQLYADNPATTPLSGNELFEATQSGASVALTSQDIAGLTTLDKALAAGSTLTEDRTVDLDGNFLLFLDTDTQSQLKVNPISFQAVIQASDGVAQANSIYNADLAGNDVRFTVYATDGTNPPVYIEGNAQTGGIEYEATGHSFEGDTFSLDNAGHTASLTVNGRTGIGTAAIPIAITTDTLVGKTISVVNGLIVDFGD